MFIAKFRFNKFTTKKATSYIFVALIFSALFFYLGLKLGQSGTMLVPQQKINSENELQTCNSDLTLCLEDGVATQEPKKETYEVSMFGIYSPLFENKELEYQAYIYRKNIIERRSVQVELGSNSVARVTTWKLKFPAEHLPDLPERLRIKRDPTDLSYSLYDFPVFDGYEFQTIVSKEKYVSERVPETPLASEIYTSARGIKMYKSKLECPKTYCGAELHFLTTVDSGKTQIFVQISTGVDYLSLNTAQIQQAIVQAFKEIQKVADTIDFESY